MRNTNNKLTEIGNELVLLYGSTLGALSSCLRGFIIPKDNHDFVGVDFSAIEARVLAWLACETGSLESFKRGEDPYVKAACDIYHCQPHEVTKQRRQIGKVAVLSLGFGGGKGAFQMMAKNYGVHVPDTEAETIKVGWRVANHNIVKFWYSLQSAALTAIASGKPTRVGKIRYEKKGSFLLCRLPSGREICYPYPKVELTKTPWGEMRPQMTAKWVDSVTRQWKRRGVWYGILCENIVQGVARDLLVSAMFTCEKKFWPVIMHVHDEVLLEVPEDGPTVDEVSDAIAMGKPEWAKGLPLALSGWKAKRYQK